MGETHFKGVVVSASLHMERKRSDAHVGWNCLISHAHPPPSDYSDGICDDIPQPDLGAGVQCPPMTTNLTSSL